VINYKDELFAVFRVQILISSQYRCTENTPYFYIGMNECLREYSEMYPKHNIVIFSELLLPRSYTWKLNIPIYPSTFKTSTPQRLVLYPSLTSSIPPKAESFLKFLIEKRGYKQFGDSIYGVETKFNSKKTPDQMKWLDETSSEHIKLYREVTKNFTPYTCMLGLALVYIQPNSHLYDETRRSKL